MKGKQIQKQQTGKKKKVAATKIEPGTANWKIPALLAGIVLLSFVIYLPVLHNSFLAWDDTYYIRDNNLIYSLNLRDIFSNNVMGNYHPITVLLLAIEYQLFELSEPGYHAVNLALHLLNVIFVFYSVLLLCKRSGVALIAALLFGIHPIHVESVAWASELKDLLYTFFFLLTFIFYLKYVAGLQKKYYALAILMFMLSVLSKGMAASLPVVLLLADFFKGRKMDVKAWLEKLPFFLIAIVFGFIAIAAQRAPDIVQDITFFTFPQRIAFACYSFITYLAKLVLPINLSAYYPYPAKTGGGISLLFYAYIPILIGLLVAVFYSLRFTKKIFFGIGFFAITIFLVLQLLPVGDAIMADRYAYVPSLGLCYLAAEGLSFLWNKNLKWIVISTLAGFTIFFSLLTHARCLVWRTDFFLWQDVIERFQTVPIAYYNRGLTYMNENKFKEAMEDYNQALALKPDYNVALVNRGNIFRVNNQNEEALRDYNHAIEVTPNLSIAFFNRGILYMNQQRNEEALADFSKAIEFKPGYYKAYSNRGVIYNNLQRYPEAIADYSKAIEINPGYMEAFYNRGMAKYSAGDKQGACDDVKASSDLGFKTATDALPQVCN
ncbi:MAG TPA: tetratricopeptide repeat protein [Saprospiraceae bacterium]|nr:tetratricopeptide repeat protein [Saprospiraceae bacterium]